MIVFDHCIGGSMERGVKYVLSAVCLLRSTSVRYIGRLLWSVCLYVIG